MRIIIITLLLFVSTIAVGQVDLTFQYRYYYNSDVIFNEDVFDWQTQQNKTIETIVSGHKNSYIGAEAFIPFSTFEESLLFSHRFSLDASAYFLYDHTANEFYQQYYDFSLNFKPFKEENIHISLPLHIEEVIAGTELGGWTGHDFKIEASYNMREQDESNLVNFYGSMSYIIFGEYNTFNPYGNYTVRTGDFQNTIGAILNIKDFFYLEQAVNIITELNNESDFPFVTFSPYYSDFLFKATVRVKKFDLDFTHICFHPFEADNKNPRISGALNSVGLTFNL